MMDGAINAIVEGEVISAGVLECEGECFFVGIVLPADANMRMSGLVEPLVEEAIQVFTADVFHGLLEIGAGGVAVAVRGVISGDAFPEDAVAELAPQHMQDPAAFFVTVGV